ncbi:hypothetical protein [Peptoniphilus sp. BV3AC2]|uniref:hypothetical protein n=1 Tax=Peptoniphilus sp. BV3AC2 TaxID=1111133 RepID=UPI0003B87EB3|nr:hypothetical protein [Peptoniphilus sp. BV3AC2]ERT64874.1 hypothetical protein HMPREF1252_1368 [Peptoniphilus sp. BV3AC2]
MERGYEEILNVLDEKRLKSNIHFASLYVLYYEYLKDSLIDLPKSFFCNHTEFKDGNIIVHESEEYKENVRKLDDHIENASFKWFITVGAVSYENYLSFNKLRKFRNKIVHELMLCLSEGFSDDEVKYLVEVIEIYRKIENWWINEVEIPTSGDIHGPYDSENVISGQGLKLEIIRDILINDGKDSEALLLEFLKQY